jgi:hypothetical protein
MTDTYETNWVLDAVRLPSQLVSTLTAAPMDVPHEGTPPERPFGLEEEPGVAAE